MKFVYSVVICGMLFACGAKEEAVVEEKNAFENQSSDEVVADSELDALMQKIDGQLADLTRIESLLYMKEDGSSAKAIAYLDKNDLITKIEEVELDGKTGIKTYRWFYSNGGVQFASKVGTIKGEGMNAYYSEEISFYDAKGNVVSSKVRNSEQEINIDLAQYYPMKSIKHDDSNAFEILRQQGKFATTFQGFVEHSGYHFLVVGENAPEGYSASLTIQQDGPTLRYLRGKGKDALGELLQVGYERMVDEMGFDLTILTSVALVKSKEEATKK